MFPFEETQDQELAIADTKRDMESRKIMDRLICGAVLDSTGSNIRHKPICPKHGTTLSDRPDGTKSGRIFSDNRKNGHVSSSTSSRPVSGRKHSGH